MRTDIVKEVDENKIGAYRVRDPASKTSYILGAVHAQSNSPNTSLLKKVCELKRKYSESLVVIYLDANREYQ